MIYIYDILLNLCDNDNIYDFYEWDNNDIIENVKRIKLIHINSDVYDCILNYNFTVDNDFLLKIFNTCELYKNKKARVINYMALFSDGSRVIAVEFNSEGLSISKSKLLLDEEDEIAILASNLELYNLNYKKGSRVLENNFLTRREMLIKRYLEKEIIDSYVNKKYDKLKYLYQEYFDEDIKCLKDMKNKLLDSLKVIDNKHKELYKLLRISSKKKQV